MLDVEILKWYNFKFRARTFDCMNAERSSYGNTSALMTDTVVWDVEMAREKAVDERSFEGGVPD